MSIKKSGSQARSSNSFEQFPSYNKQDTFPLINSINEQNQLLKKQINNIKTELMKLSKISQYVLSQNKQLKVHFQNRTNDIRNYISSLQINMNEQMQDTYHEIHLTSESNCLLAKNIQFILPLIEQNSLIVKQKQSEKMKIDEQLISLKNDKQMVNRAKMQTTLSQTNVQKLKKYQQKLNNQVQNLQSQIGDLSIMVGELNKSNQSKVQQVKKQKEENHLVKTNTKELTIYTINHIKQLKKQLQKVQGQSKNQQNQLRKCLNRHNQIQMQVKKLQKQRAQFRILWQKQQMEILLTKQKINSIKNKFSQVQLIKHQKQEQKGQLQKALVKKKTLIMNLKQNQSNQINVMNEQIKQTQSKIKNQENNKLSNYQNQMQKLRELNLKSDENLQFVKKQYDLLNTDFQEYNDLVKGLDNPISEIERIQMRMRLKEGIKPLASIF